MFGAVKDFTQGLGFHGRGMRFGLRHPSLLGLALLPFFVTLILYVFAFYLFTLYAEELLHMIWQTDPESTGRYVGWLYWVYTHVVKYLLYGVVLVVMFYSFIILSNILASPFYDVIVTKYTQQYGHERESEATGSTKGILTIMKEETKKAVFMLFIPLILMFVPVIGALIGFIVAAIFVAWDYVDFSLSRDCPLLKDRLGQLWRHKASLIGFGFPLVIPFVGLIMVPFAILGSTLLYHEKILSRRAS